ncbi:uncharacterized protein LOC141633032 [Silene latifolia]|uniref:uncharacterized protein LOC141633032 n=1 Tax=Silene latifolia TaxID=37657 RepID=UPI003D7761A1
MCDTPEQVLNAFLDYYQHLLGASQETNKIQRKIIDQGPRCNADHYVQLTRPVTGKEVTDTLFSIPDIKSLGPDGYTMEWSFVEQLVDSFNFSIEFKDMVLQCITTASFSLLLNGDMFGYFQGKRGLRQGDQLSPLIFTLCMEYLTRTLKYAADKFEFNYHPLCKDLKLAKMMFPDDVLLFSRGMLLLKSFATFSKASGLQASMFILPKGIISRIEATCRNFLWDNSADYRRVPLVSWDKVCRGKEEGGLGLKDQETMNEAMIGRMVHWIIEEKDSIWVQWVKKNYLKGKDWLEYKPTANSSWV